MRRRIVVAMGGISEERDVSLRSGKAIAEALREQGHDVIPVDLRTADIVPIREVAPEAVFIALHGRFGEDGTIQALLEEALTRQSCRHGQNGFQMFLHHARRPHAAVPTDHSHAAMGEG